jgi:diacylglycerol kinase (ATP)
VDPLLVITNAEAGTADEENLAAALAVLRERASVEVAATSRPGELDGVLHRAGSRRIVVAGGDGSLHAVIAALHRRQELKNAVLGLLPLGTGNDFARGVGIPLDVEEAARVVLDGVPSRMDLVVDEVGEIVVNSVHVGAGANASRRGHRWKARLHSVGVGKVNLGKLGYPIGALLTAWNPPIIRVRLEVDGQVVADLDQPILMAAVGNGTSVGGGAELTPEADPSDGKVDVMVSRSIGPLARFSYAARLGLATHHERDDVTYLRGRTVSVSGGPFWCSADGEIYGPERHRTWHVEPEAYHLVLPRPEGGAEA